MGKGWPLTGLYTLQNLQDRVGITVYRVYIMFDALSFCSRLSDRSCSLQLEKNSYNAYYILFIFIDIDKTYTCTYVVSKLFAPRTIKLYSSGFTGKYVI